MTGHRPHIPYSFSKAWTFSFFVSLLFVLPLSVNLVSVGEKPIDLVPSDVVWLLVPLAALLNWKIPRFAIFAFLPFLYFIASGIIGSLRLGGALGPILSSTSFFMPFIHIVTGALVYRKMGGIFLHTLAQAIAIVVILIGLSDAIFGSFPRGCGYEGRWGGCIGVLEVYGFPNSSMNFLALCMFLSLFFLANSERRAESALFQISFLFLCVLGVLSLSRSAALLIFILAGCLLVVKSRIFLFPIMGVLFILLVYSLDAVLRFALLEGLVMRFSAAVDSGDITTGRVDIWSEALVLIAERPLFGYMFEYFSSFSSFGTPHQQFLEVLFKAGAVGFFIYFGFLFYVVSCCWSLLRELPARARRVARVYFVGFCISSATSSLFAPIFSYQTFGNLVFLLCGFSMAAYYEKVRG